MYLNNIPHFTKFSVRKTLKQTFSLTRKKTVLFVVALCCLSTVVASQKMFGDGVDPDHPQSKRFSNFPGTYQLLATLSKSSFYPGDSVDIQVYFVGYGLNKASKFTMKCSEPVFDTSSFVRESLYIDTTTATSTTATLLWGHTTTSLPEPNGFSLSIKGVEQNDTSNQQYGFYYDDNSKKDNYRIITEGFDKNRHSPIDLHLISRCGINDGNYYINLNLTYFNGEKWEATTQVLNFHVNSWLEEYAEREWWAGIVIGLISILPLLKEGVLIIFRFVKNLVSAKKAKTKIGDSAALPNTEVLSYLETFIKQEITKNQTLSNKKIEDEIAKRLAVSQQRKKK